MKAVLGPLICLFLAACSSGPGGPVIIKNKDHLSVSISGGGPHDFVPDEGLISEIEEKLPKQIAQVMKEDTFVRKEDKAWIIYELKNYDRRYMGITDDSLDRRSVVIDLYHKNLKMKEEDLKSLNWSADGGGYNIWSITYDVEKGTFGGFYMNAQM